jgi:hypothetical protein
MALRSFSDSLGWSFSAPIGESTARRREWGPVVVTLGSYPLAALAGALFTVTCAAIVALSTRSDIIGWTLSAILLLIMAFVIRPFHKPPVYHISFTFLNFKLLIRLLVWLVLSFGGGLILSDMVHCAWMHDCTHFRLTSAIFTWVSAVAVGTFGYKVGDREAPLDTI